MSKITKTITFSLAFMLLVLTACHKEAENKTIETDVQQFEAVWNELNDTYVFWSVDTTDWDAVYTKYHPIFEEMENEPDSVWKTTWKELTTTLLDHHLTIDLFRPSRNGFLELTPGWDEVKGRDYYHDKKTHNNMLNTMSEVGRLTNTSSSKYCYSGILDNRIAYIYISSFYKVLLDSIPTFTHFKHLVAMENIEATIIDVRDNSGGGSENLVPLLSCFTTEPVLIGYTQAKFGLGKYNMSPKIPAIVNPVLGQRREIPIIVLADINSGSMADLTPIALRHLPKCYVVGERTFGATGPVQNDKIENSYALKTAELLFEDVDGTIYEGRGVEPDIKCLFDESLWNSGIDNQLEMAISVALDKIAENGN